ncbi:MAG: PorV/PorQ family protein [Balneola sp.]
MKKLSLTFFVLILAGLVSEGNAQLSKVGTSAAEFLKIPVGARASAMSAFTATVNDPSAMVLNPAGLADVVNNQALVEFTDWYLDFTHSYVGIGIPTKKGVAGIHVLAMNYGEFDETTEQAQGRTGRTFNAYSLTVGGSYSQYMNENLSIGGTVKFVYEKIENTSASGVAFDIGTLYETPFDQIRFGVSVTNVGTKMQIRGNGLITNCDLDDSSQGNSETDCNLSTQEYDLPLMLRVGLAWDAFQSDDIRATLTIDGNNPSNNVQSVSIGGEISLLNDLVQLRGGIPYIGQDDRTETFNAGIGIKYQVDSSLGLGFNYAYHGYEYLGDVNKLSLQVYF